MIIFKQPRVNAIAPAITGGLIAAGGALFGGLLNNNAAKSSNSSNTYNQQLADQAAMGRQRDSQLYNKNQARLAYERQKVEAEKDREMQREFAQHGVSWKAEDARSVGLDPLAAMGSNTFYSPVGRSITPGSSGIASPGNAPRSIPTDYSWLGEIGQQLGRTAVKAMTAEQLAHEVQMKQLTEKNLSLDNEWKLIRNTQANMELANYGSQVGVPFPSTHSQQISGQTDSVQVIPDKVVRHQGGHKAGLHALRQYRLGEKRPDGTIPIYSTIEQEAGDAMDADLPTKARYNARELGSVVRSWAGKITKPKPKIKPPKGHKLQWNRLYGQWEFAPHGKVRIKRRYGDPRDRGTKRQRYKIY